MLVIDKRKHGNSEQHQMLLVDGTARTTPLGISVGMKMVAHVLERLF